MLSTNIALRLMEKSKDTTYQSIHHFLKNQQGELFVSGGFYSVKGLYR